MIYRGDKLPANIKIDPRDYYKELPSIYHETGDIWMNIPCFGLNKNRFTRAIVITPSCDLSQSKSETITVLPIITLSDYIYSKCFFYEIWQEVHQILSEAGICMINRYKNPCPDDVRTAIEIFQSEKAKEKSIVKLNEYCKYIMYCENNDSEKPDLKKIFSEKNLNNKLSSIMTNAYRSDIHFLPHDGNNYNGNILDDHSLVLFRYSFSFPVDVLDLASYGSEDTWLSDIKSLEEKYPLASLFEKYPINVSTLKDDFLSDLLSRYLSMYMRLGSRDFTKETLSNFLTHIKRVI
ncbi:hypothetical protein QUF31_00545 [Dickeya chrysanthemi]|uniref:hypothetical protein n=1 Tax=Dickeya chrysanthemi TaxID=556 RepID=UPI0025A2BCCF|nr:hypothetical protein [Dickeya chrysanthemi]WJM85659.1 hypothetical protein QUF31_00545 [Dickeya chrysanthemi]